MGAVGGGAIGSDTGGSVIRAPRPDHGRGERRDGVGGGGGDGGDGAALARATPAPETASEQAVLRKAVAGQRSAVADACDGGPTICLVAITTRCTAPARQPARRHPARLPKTGTVYDESTAWAPHDQGQQNAAWQTSS
ncbi:MAG TPA: hypothetical protein VEF72_04695 [Mycobacterium sp.]|nr:hypothetical protein [Mycobacterium sp.]